MTGEITHLNSNVVALIPFGVFALVGIFKRDDFTKIDWHVLWMVAGGFAIGTALNKSWWNLSHSEVGQLLPCWLFPVC